MTNEEYLERVRLLVTDDRKVSKGSNLQNIPSKSKGHLVRNCFVPATKNGEKYFFIGSDLGQIEPRIMAHIMYDSYGDNSMRQIFVDGVDLYSTMAQKVFNLAPEYCLDKAYEPTGRFQPRKLMKLGVLAVSYDQQPKQFAKNMGVDISVAEEFFELYDKAFPSFKTMVKDIKEGMKRNGYVETLFGRKRRFPQYNEFSEKMCKNERRLTDLYIERKKLNAKLVKSPTDVGSITRIQEQIDELAEIRNMVGYWERAAFNAVIQGTGADILKANMVAMYSECRARGWELNASIHDEIKISVPARDLTLETIDLVKRVMTETVTLTVPLVTDTVIESKWGDEVSPEDWDFVKQRKKEAK